MTENIPPSENSAKEVVYGPRPARLLAAGGLLAVLGAFSAWPWLIAFPAWIHGAAEKSAPSVFGLLGGVLFLGLGISVVAGLLRGLPRLTVTPAGIRLESTFSTKWAEWSSLSTFELSANYVGIFRRAAYADADIVGTAVSKNLLGKKRLVIANSFRTPIEAIVSDLNARHAQITGTAPDPHTAARRREAENKFGIAGYKIPWLTFSILAVLVAVFVAEQIFAIEPPGPLLRPTVATLAALGAVNRSLVMSNGEWYRLFTAPLLHGDVLHLVFNGIAFLMVGDLLERLVGRVWFSAFFIIGAIGGSLMSVAINPADTTSVGASGAIMGMFAAAYASSFRLPARSMERSRIQARSLAVLIPSLLPLVTGGASQHVDYAAHFGGALSGAAVSFFLLKAWPDSERLPGFRKLAAGIAVAGMVALAASSAAVADRYSSYKALASLIPNDQLPKREGNLQSVALNLMSRYPDDPRSHMYYGAALAEARDNPAAEREFRKALKQAEDLRFFFGPQFENRIRVMLAEILREEGRQPEAREVARNACRSLPTDGTADKLRQTLTEERLCD